MATPWCRYSFGNSRSGSSQTKALFAMASNHAWSTKYRSDIQWKSGNHRILRKNSNLLDKLYRNQVDRNPNDWKCIHRCVNKSAWFHTWRQRKNWRPLPPKDRIVTGQCSNIYHQDGISVPGIRRNCRIHRSNGRLNENKQDYQASLWQEPSIFQAHSHYYHQHGWQRHPWSIYSRLSTNRWFRPRTNKTCSRSIHWSWWIYMRKQGTQLSRRQCNSKLYTGLIPHNRNKLIHVKTGRGWRNGKLTFLLYGRPSDFLCSIRTKGWQCKLNTKEL